MHFLVTRQFWTAPIPVDILRNRLAHLVAPVEEGASRRRLYIWVGLGVTCLLVTHALVLKTPVWPLDDGYITAHNAEVLRSGRDAVYTHVSPLSGATSLVHLALITILSFLLPTLWSQYVVGALAVLAYALGITRLAARYRLNDWIVTAVILVALTTGLMTTHLFNGLETGLALATAVWLCVLSEEPGREAAFGLLCGIAPFVRPELGMLSALVLLMRLCAHIRKREWLRAARLIGYAAAGATPWAAWSLLAAGSIAGNTAVAKQAFFAESRIDPNIKGRWILSSLTSFVTAVGLAVVGAGALYRRPTGIAALAFAGAFILLFFAFLPGGLSHNYQRYLYLLFPFCVVGLIYGAGQSGRAGKIWAGIALAAAVRSLLYLPANMPVFLGGRYRTEAALAPVTVWCNTHLPADATLLIHDAGYIGYAGHHRATDLVGLKTPWVISYHRMLTAASVGRLRSEAIHRIALRAHSDYLVVFNEWDGIFKISAGLQQHGWSLRRLYAGEYSVYALRPPSPIQHASTN